MTQSIQVAASGTEKSGVNRFFFDQSNNLQNEIIALHEFVLPMATAMWNFRGTIQQALAEIPSPSVTELSERYNTAPNTRGTTNLIRPFDTITWDDQLQRIAEVALVNIIAIFEVWCDEICTGLGDEQLAIRLQFPTNTSRTKGVGSVLDAFTANESTALKTSIYPALTSAKKYSLLTIDNLLKCFRYFKELRNAFMHRGRRCDGKLYGAQSDFVPVAKPEFLGMDFVPDFTQYQQGDRIDLSLHGVLGFTEVILRIVTTVDAELSRSAASETEVIRRIKAAKQTPIARPDSLRSVFNTFGIQGVCITEELTALLRSNGVLA